MSKHFILLLAFIVLYIQERVQLSVTMEVCALETTHVHVLGAGLAQPVSRPSAQFRVSTVVVSPLPLSAYVMQAGEDPTAIKV